MSGHSFMSCDGNFAVIQNKAKYDSPFKFAGMSVNGFWDMKNFVRQKV